MHQSTAFVETNHASRYLQQLCKHWSHKFTVEFTPEDGIIPFDETSRLQLSADARGLKLVLSTADGEQTERLEGVVADHLKRFAFREELEFNWSNGA
jgi:uncharacterized protein